MTVAVLLVLLGPASSLADFESEEAAIFRYCRRPGGEQLSADQVERYLSSPLELRYHVICLMQARLNRHLDGGGQTLYSESGDPVANAAARSRVGKSLARLVHAESDAALRKLFENRETEGYEAFFEAKIKQLPQAKPAAP